MADPDLYRRNPFRVTGLATDARSREVRQRRQTVLGLLDLGAGTEVNDKRLPLPEPPSANEARTAFDALERADHRLVDELFWWWGDPGECGCAEQVHVLHDIAVEAHAKALDFEAGETGAGRGERFDLWADAADAWMDALDCEGFWDHVRHRMRALSDRRLDESTVDGLRRTMPHALLAPQAALARKSETSAVLAGLLDMWDVDTDVIDDARTSAAAATYERITTQLKEIGALRDNDKGGAAARRAMDELPPAADLLETLVPHERFRRSANLRNRIAVMMNNCALDLAETPAKPYQKLKLGLLEHAVELVVEPKDREIIQTNLDDHRKTPFTGTSGRAVPGAQWNQVTRVIRAGQLEQAADLLRELRAATTDPGERAQIDSMLRNLERAGVGQVAPAEPAAPRTWFANLALCLGFVAGVVFLMVGQWNAPVWATAVMTAVLAPIPLTIVYTDGYRDRAGPVGFVLVGLIACVLACIAIGHALRYGPAPVLWCLGVFIVTLPVTSQIGKSWAERWDLR